MAATIFMVMNIDSVPAAFGATFGAAFPPEAMVRGADQAPDDRGLRGAAGAVHRLGSYMLMPKVKALLVDYQAKLASGKSKKVK